MNNNTNQQLGELIASVKFIKERIEKLENIEENLTKSFEKFKVEMRSEIDRKFDENFKKRLRQGLIVVLAMGLSFALSILGYKIWILNYVPVLPL